jgi:hypothetical protein
MKTPREILLARHRSAESKLDAIRGAVLPRATPPGARFIREFLLPLRWHFAGMSAAWLLVALLNTYQTSPAVTAADVPRSSPRQLLVALAENRRRLVEVIDESAIDIPAAAQPFVPPRRGAVQTTCAIV